MNYTNYIGTLRSNLCFVLSAQKANVAKIDSLNDNIILIELTPNIERPDSSCMTLNELYSARKFLKEIDNIYEKEVSRLISTLLLKTKTEI